MQINSNGAGSSDVKVIALSSTGRELNCKLSEKDNSLIANFIPDEIGINSLVFEQND